MAIFDKIVRWFQPEVSITIIVDTGSGPSKMYGPFRGRLQAVQWVNTTQPIGSHYTIMTLNRP